MIADRIGQIVAVGKYETLGFEGTTDTRREAAPTVYGMLNRQGGQIQFDVTSDGQEAGRQLEERIFQEIGAELGRIDSPAFPTIDRIPLAHGRETVTVEVRDVEPVRFRCDDGPSFRPTTTPGEIELRQGVDTGSATRLQSS